MGAFAKHQRQCVQSRTDVSEQHKKKGVESLKTYYINYSENTVNTAFMSSALQGFYL